MQLKILILGEQTFRREQCSHPIPCVLMSNDIPMSPEGMLHTHTALYSLL